MKVLQMVGNKWVAIGLLILTGVLVLTKTAPVAFSTVAIVVEETIEVAKDKWQELNELPHDTSSAYQKMVSANNRAATNCTVEDIKVACDDVRARQATLKMQE